MIRVCIVTASRAEYGLMRPVLAQTRAAEDLALQLVVTGTHLDPAYGATCSEIEADGFEIDARIPLELDPADPIRLTAEVGDLGGRLAETFGRLRPDLCLVMGDRYELMGLATACVLNTLPLGHVSGGSVTEGAIDEQIRHAMTKIAHLHFVSNETYAARLRQMGEEPWRICVSGEPGLDNLATLPLMTREELESELGLDLSRPTALVSYHSETLAAEQTAAHCAQLISALEQADLQYLASYPNADPGSPAIIAALEDFAARQPDRVRLVKSLGQRRYLSALRVLDLMIGNSSSGIVEAPSFNLPVVNIGARQAGRMRAPNVIDVAHSCDAILGGIRRALDYDRSQPCENPFGDGRAAERITGFIARAFAEHGRAGILRKRFVDLNP